MLSLFYFTGEDWSLKGNQTDLLSYFLSFSLLDFLWKNAIIFLGKVGCSLCFASPKRGTSPFLDHVLRKFLFHLWR